MREYVRQRGLRGGVLREIGAGVLQAGGGGGLLFSNVGF